MEAINILIIIFLVVLMSSIFINGFYAITRGRWEVKTNGEKYWTGKIFSFWHKFFQAHTIKKEQYHGKMFYIEFERMKELGLIDVERVVASTESYFMYEITKEQAPLFMAKAKLKGIDLRVHFLNGNNTSDRSIGTFFVEKEVKVDKIPDLIKDPLATCITCFASVYGVITWFFFIGIFHWLESSGVGGVVTLIVNMPTWMKVGWLVFHCFSLAYTNEILNHLNQKLKK